MSTASQIGIEMNNNLLSSPYKPYKPNVPNIASPPKSVYYSNHSNDRQSHHHIQHNMTQLKILIII